MIDKLYQPQHYLNCDVKRLIAVGDVHGQYKLLKMLIETEIRFDPANDSLIFLGDYIDRSTPENDAAVVNYLINLANYNPGHVLLLRGNHEQMAVLAISGNEEYKARWAINGAGDKLKWPAKVLSALSDFCSALPKYYETEKFLFVHAGAHRNIDISQQSEGRLLWQRGELWGYESTDRSIKQLVVGHTPTECPSIIKNEHAICVDLGAFKSGRLAGYDVINDKEYIARIPK